MAMMGGNGMPNGWNVKQIKAQESYENAQTVKSWIIDQIGGSSFFWAVNETKRDLGLNNTQEYAMIALQVIRSNNIDTGAYLRYANGAYNAGTNLSLSYSLYVDIGDDITIFYK